MNPMRETTLATEANNHFGIKCGKEWTGKTIYKFDDDRDANGFLIEILLSSLPTTIGSPTRATPTICWASLK